MKIKTPKGYNKNIPSYKVDITWNAVTFDDMNNKLKLVLAGISEYSKDIMNDKYVPKTTGKLVDSCVINYLPNETASIKWTAPYAIEVYYDKNTKLEGKRGPMWFDRMFEDYQKRIEKEANRIYKG